MEPDALHLFPNGVSSHHCNTTRGGGRIPQGWSSRVKGDDLVQLAVVNHWPFHFLPKRLVLDGKRKDVARSMEGAGCFCSFSINCFLTTWRYRHQNQSLSSSLFVSDKESFQRRPAYDIETSWQTAAKNTSKNCQDVKEKTLTGDLHSISGVLLFFSPSITRVLRKGVTSCAIDRAPSSGRHSRHPHSRGVHIGRPISPWPARLETLFLCHRNCPL